MMWCKINICEMIVAIGEVHTDTYAHTLTHTHRHTHAHTNTDVLSEGNTNISGRMHMRIHTHAKLQFAESLLE